jgi:hypothetical protein
MSLYSHVRYYSYKLEIYPNYEDMTVTNKVDSSQVKQALEEVSYY